MCLTIIAIQDEEHNHYFLFLIKKLLMSAFGIHIKARANFIYIAII